MTPRILRRLTYLKILQVRIMQLTSAFLVHTFLGSFSNCTKLHFNLLILDCQNGWTFDTTWYDENLPMGREWVCDRSIFTPRWLSVGLAGQVFGSLIFTLLADMYVQYVNA